MEGGGAEVNLHSIETEFNLRNFYLFNYTHNGRKNYYLWILLSFFLFVLFCMFFLVACFVFCFSCSFFFFFFTIVCFRGFSLRTTFTSVVVELPELMTDVMSSCFTCRQLDWQRC